ncbi:class II aldolase [Ideonella sp. TBM-1]|uniref:Class II aldolase n=1 Tax=Ideonella livida TaxID=2707176 RepID=A0A7C9PIW4_9BURK|nr:class II aldolase [Ideonella livida]
MDAAELAARQALIAHARRLGPSGLSAGTSGNLSLRWTRAGTPGLLITPSGVDYAALQPEHLAFMRLEDGRWGGPLKPSSEWRFHLDILRARPEVQAIVHAHPTHATALAVQRRPLPAFHYMVAQAGGRDIRCADYATYGTAELSANALAALQDRHACLLANHGLIATGARLEAAFHLALEVEALARQYLLALATGTPVILPDDEMDRILVAFRHYGANAQNADASGNGQGAPAAAAP